MKINRKDEGWGNEESTTRDALSPQLSTIRKLRNWDFHFGTTRLLTKFEFVLPYGHWDLATQQDNLEVKNYMQITLRLFGKA